jgi:hypothetical protein
MVLDQLDAPRSAGELTPIRRASPLLVTSRCYIRPPALPGLELAIPGDVAAGIEGLVVHSLDATVAGIGHGLLDLPTPDSLSVETVFGPSYSRLIKTGLDDASCRAVAQWGGAVFFISNQLSSAREQLDWHSDWARAAERRKAKDTIDMRLASRLAGQWGGAEGAQSLRNQVHERETKPPKPNRGGLDARLAVATLEGRLNYLLSIGGASSRAAIGLAALCDARGWGEIAALVAGSGLTCPVASGEGRTKADPEARAKAWLDQLANEAVLALVKAWGSASQPGPRCEVIAPPGSRQLTHGAGRRNWSDFMD